MTKIFKTVLGCGLIACLQLTSWAQSEWPKTKPVTLLVAFAPGSSTDIVARYKVRASGRVLGPHRR
jgi:tripartite-type tricarboxylate transporter receptor subunit TctC